MSISTLTPEQIIKAIKEAYHLSEIMDVANIKKEYIAIMKKIHTDVCHLPGANDAIQRLMELQDKFKVGTKYVDDAGDFVTNGNYVHFKGDAAMLKTSLANWKKLMSYTTDEDKKFQRYMASNMVIEDGILKTTFSQRTVPLADLNLDQKHVNWILSRILEFETWLARKGYVHCGINPESIFIVPDSHGIKVCSYYHMSRIDNKVTTVSAKYKNWYPHKLFSEKLAKSYIDLELAKKVAICLLGDKSGSGIKFKKTHNEDFIHFVTTMSTDPNKAFIVYRELLDKNFKKEFHILKV